MRKTSTLMLTTSILVVSASAALAHAWLRSATPPVDGTVAQASSEVTIGFTGAIEPSFSTVRVAGDGAGRVDDAQPRQASGDATWPPIGLRNIKPRVYSVVWHATSVDTHQTDGTYRLNVADTDPSGISLDHVWARPTPGAGTTGVTYFTVIDKGQPDRLIGVSSPIAAVAELHETVNDNGVMKMRSVQSVALAPGKPVTFKPGSYHVMLMGLKNPLKAGDSFPLTLTFEHAQPITVTAKVEAAGTAVMGHGDMPGMPGMKSQ